MPNDQQLSAQQSATSGHFEKPSKEKGEVYQSHNNHINAGYKRILSQAAYHMP
jgi:hypothetical protein